MGQVIEAYFYRFVGTFAESQNNILAEVGRDIWIILSNSPTQAGPPTADLSAPCPEGF